MKWTRDVRPEGIGLHSALLWSERQRLGVALVASIVTHGFALALTPIVQLEPQALPEVLQVELVALAPSQPESDLAPPDGAGGPASAQLAPETAPPEPAPPPPEAVIEAEPPKPKPARVEKKPKPQARSKPPERIERNPPSPPPEPPPAGALAQVDPIADPSPVPSPQIERSASAPEPPVETARAEPQLALAMPSREAALDEYRQALSNVIVRDRYYPPIARARGWEGTVKVQIRIGPGQKVHEIAIERSSGFKALDTQALEMVRKAQPFPPVPKALGEIVFSIPISFELGN